MQNQQIRITWYGTASVRIVAGDSQLLIDPFIPFPDSTVRIPQNAYVGCPDILITHGHYDHIGSIREIAQTDTTVYCTEAPFRSLCRKGVNKSNLRLIDVGSAFTVGAFHVTAFQGSHIKLSVWDGLKAIFCKRVWKNRKGAVRKIMKLTSCREKKESLCYLIEGYGKRILILGSLALADNTAYPQDIDLALFPYQGLDQLFGIAKHICQTIRPRAVLLTHFDDTFPPFSSVVDTSEFEEYLKNRVPVYKLAHGGTLEI